MSRFRPSRMIQLGNALVTPLVRRGLPIGVNRAPMAVLTVQGRRSGLSRQTPVSLLPRDDGWLLVSVYGVSDWARNLEAAQVGEVTIRGRTIPVRARRLSPHEAGPILRDSLADAPAMIRRMTAPYFNADHDSPIEEWEREAFAHPVFTLSEVLAGPD